MHQVLRHHLKEREHRERVGRSDERLAPPKPWPSFAAAQLTTASYMDKNIVAQQSRRREVVRKHGQRHQDDESSGKTRATTCAERSPSSVLASSRSVTLAACSRGLSRFIAALHLRMISRVTGTFRTKRETRREAETEVTYVGLALSNEGKNNTPVGTLQFADCAEAVTVGLDSTAFRNRRHSLWGIFHRSGKRRVWAGGSCRRRVGRGLQLVPARSQETPFLA